MSEQNRSKLNSLLRSIGDADLVSARWLRENGYSSSLVARYVRSGWLRSPTRGVYGRAEGVLSWDGVLHSLQQREGLRVHAGGRFALAWHGHEHYLRLGENATVTLYGADRLPGWVFKLPLDEHCDYRGLGPFGPADHLLNAEIAVEQLYDLGLERQQDSSMAGEVILASPERAVLELCAEVTNAAQIIELDAVMQGLAGLRPELLSQLLRMCRSVKTKRLFLALAERHRHPWVHRLVLTEVDLGSGKRVLVRGGRLDPKYLITLPADLGEQLG